MAPRKRPTEQDRDEAVRVALTGLASGEDSWVILQRLGDLHIRYNTFPAEELLELAADAIEVAGATRSEPIDYEQLRERYLPDHKFSGRPQHHKSHYALTAAAMIPGGVYPDLLGEVEWWRTDDLWTYAFYAFLVYARAAAERTDRSVEEVVDSIANRRGITLGSIDR
jgi:hypothetical protein